MNQLPNLKRMQGVSFLGFLSILILVFLIGTTILRSVPSYMEYQSVKRAVNWAKQNSNNRKDFLATFDKQAQLDRIEAITSKDLDIDESNGGMVVGFKYRKEIELFGPISLLITYANETH